VREEAMIVSVDSCNGKLLTLMENPEYFRKEPFICF
jgi:hypothetical protein